MHLVFRLDGAYWGFVAGDQLYDRRGRHVGWLAGRDVYRLSGRLLGELHDEGYVLRNPLRGEAVPLAPRAPVPHPAPPAPPPDRAPRVPHGDWRDALGELAREGGALT